MTQIAPLSQVYSIIESISVNNPQPAALIDGTEGFTSNTGQFSVTSYNNDPTGTLAISGGVGTLNYGPPGGTNSSFWYLNSVTLPIPQGFISVDLISASAVATTPYLQISVGLYSTGLSVDFGCSAFQNGTTLAAGTGFSFAAMHGGVKTTFGNCTLPTSGTVQSIGISFNGDYAGGANGAWVSGWVKMVGGAWQCIGVGGRTGMLLGDPSFLPQYHPGFAVWDSNPNNALGYTVKVTNLKYGRYGALGIRDPVVVTNQSGVPYNPSGNLVLFTAACTDANGAANTGLFSLDVGSLALTQIGVIMVSRGGYVYSDTGMHIVLNNSGNTDVLSATNAAYGTLNILLTTLTGQSITSGGSLVITPSSTPSLPNSGYGVYDPFLVFNPTTNLWMLAYTGTAAALSASGNGILVATSSYPALATSPDLVTWTAAGVDTSKQGYEGTRLYEVNGDYYLLNGGPAGSGNKFNVYDTVGGTTLSYLGNLDATANGGALTQPHPMVFPFNQLFYLLTFDDTEVLSGASGTWGKLVLQSAYQFTQANTHVYPQCVFVPAATYKANQSSNLNGAIPHIYAGIDYTTVQAK